YVVDFDAGGQGPIRPSRLTFNKSSDLDPSWSPDGSQIVFASDRGGDYDIYLMDADGSNLTNISAALSQIGGDPELVGSKDLGPVWSGDQIAFHSDRSGDWDIYVTDREGSQLDKLTDSPSLDMYPSWSPDGSQITFHSLRDGNYGVYTMDSNGDNETPLTTDPTSEAWPQWPPASSPQAPAPGPQEPARIVFTSTRDNNYEIYVMDSDGSGQVRLTDHAAIDYYPAPSPDGSK
ncbi:uncharacterized protein METZ01_LOCUS503023, partial [marine metagenome]